MAGYFANIRLLLLKVKEDEGGRLFVVNGATGKVMGQYMDIPHNREIYIPPIMHTTFDRSKYVMFGSGGIGDLGADGKIGAFHYESFWEHLNIFLFRHKSQILQFIHNVSYF